ncbi:hypothetical protein Q8A67_012482 [Cirrhinus molitorella]|uniref:Uncharacterized protein n=1 Tax=Cirrhinus molitorella TaxID=172907 RepID=A0AA88PME8_9TELE|nr:hypothetical protein Q8A67_012482 [Cirrhinus molitorella]
MVSGVQIRTRATYGGNIVLTVDQRDHSLTVTDSCLNTYLTRYGIIYSPNDVDAIEEHFLYRPDLEMCINEDSLITSIIQPSSQNQVDQTLIADDSNRAMDGKAGKDWEVVEAGETVNQDVQESTLADEPVSATEVE